MAALHEALQSLAPVSWDAIPTNSPDELRAYTAKIFKDSRLIVETVPEPPTPYISRSHTDLRSSSPVSVPQLASLKKEWGKPIKINNAKENPLGISLYKLYGRDGKGAWFARRSIHDGLPFSRWKAKMQVEMEETLKARQEELRQGRTPGTSIRGIGGDRRLETVEIRDASREGALGHVEVYQLSAQFSGPTTPRDFVTLMITTNRALDDDDDAKLPRSYLIVSKPCDHPDAPPRGGYIRGQYEAVEFIREIPVKSSTKKTSSNAKAQERPAAPRAVSFPAHLNYQGNTRSKGQLQDCTSDRSASHSGPTGRNRGQTETAVQDQQEGETEDDEDFTNPVEWIMITRSDPGGSVPRWMVERGTPKSIAVDAAKFLNWASQPDVVSGDVEDQRRESISSLEMNGRLAGIDGTENNQPNIVQADSKIVKQLNESIGDPPEDWTDDDDDDYDEPQTENSLWASVSSLIQTGLESYAPRAVLNYIPGHSPQPSERQSGNRTVPIMDNEASPQDNDDSASLTSNDSFTSADSNMHASVSDDVVPASTANRGQSQSSISLGGSSNAPKDSREALVQSSDRKSKLTSHEKDLAKLAARKEDVEAKLRTVRLEIESLGRHPAKHDVDSGVDSDRTSTSSSNVAKQNANKKVQVHSQAQAAVQDQKRHAQLSHTESKLVSQLHKIEAQQLKIENKLELRQRKEAQRREKARSRSEIEDLRREVDDLRRQVRELRDERGRWLDLVGRLQRENTRLVATNHGGSLRGLSSREGYGTD